MKQVIVTISEDGEVRIDATGFKGSACEKATAEIERALGTPGGGSRTKKPEYYQGNQQQQTQGN